MFGCSPCTTLLHAAVLNVKGKTCLVIDPNVSEKSFKSHWVPVCVPDEAVQKTFESHGKVKSIVHKKWRQPGFENVETTIQTVTMVFKEGTTVGAIPHQINILGMPALVSIPGRPPQCLRCKKVGHTRKQCRTYGHEEDNCIQTYAAKTRPPTEPQDVDNLMDQDEMEETIAGTSTGKASELSSDVVGAANSAPPASGVAEVKVTEMPSPKMGENSQKGQVKAELVERKGEKNRKASEANDRYSGGTAYCRRPTPPWQKEITTFFTAKPKEPSGSSESGKGSSTQADVHSNQE
ncbi:hypothetical protein HPB47_009693 [Ixodes persulcatus]|uniref:Uncharacterized protein n=1 Tax=Ixodes persulcatus TaxID=34615 RepID=A0AC60P1H7_IXOPE|nr:hypothetical protein HPB47_009693 [Ixodes persulcatus]